MDPREEKKERVFILKKYQHIYSNFCSWCNTVFFNIYNIKKYIQYVKSKDRKKYIQKQGIYKDNKQANWRLSKNKTTGKPIGWLVKVRVKGMCTLISFDIWLKSHLKSADLNWAVWYQKGNSYFSADNISANRANDWFRNDWTSLISMHVFDGVRFLSGPSFPQYSTEFISPPFCGVTPSLIWRLLGKYFDPNHNDPLWQSITNNPMI